MTQTTTGWVVFLAAIGMMFALLGVDIVALKDWDQLYTTTFIGTFIGHIAAVIAAFVGGKLIPENRPDGTYTRKNDVPQSKNDGSNK